MVTGEGREEGSFDLRIRCGPLREVSVNVHVFMEVTPPPYNLEITPNVPSGARG
jgi:hypothetical protein